MTDHDYWLEDMQAMKKRQKPNYPRRRNSTSPVAAGRLIVTSTLMLTWHGGSTTARSWWKACTSPPHCADRQIRATRLKTSRWLTVQTNNQKSGVR